MNRLKSVATHLTSRRGLLLIASTLAAILAILLDGTPRIVLGIIAVTGFSTLTLILSMRISQAMAEMRRPAGKETQKPPLAQVATFPEEDDRSALRMTTAIEMLQTAALSLDARQRMESGLSEKLDRQGPSVTVVVPCFNEETLIAESLRSVLEQSFAGWECIVVDDASTDRSLSEIWSVAKGDERFRVLRHRVNSGLSAARNTGLRAARGRFIAFLDADDLLMRESLMDRVMVLSNHESDPYVVGAYCGVRVSPQEVTLEELPRRMKFESGRVVDFVTADSECPFNAHAPLLIVDRLRALGGFDESMRLGAEDWDLWYRAMRNGYVFVPSRYTTAVYRQKRFSMVRSMPDGHVAEADRLINAAHRIAEPAIFTAPTPTPLTRPIGHYQALLHRADRAIRFAAMALVGGDEAAARRALKVLEEVPLALVERHLDMANLTNRGMMRALAVSPRELHSVELLSLPILDRLRDLIHDVSADYKPELQEASPSPFVDALLIPQHAGQLSSMLKMTRSSGFAESAIAVLDIEREGGQQGVERLTGGLARWSLNQWVLRGGTCDTVLVGSVRTGVVDQIARAVAAQGGRVVEVPQPHVDLMNLPDASRKDLEGTGSSPVTLGASMFGPQVERLGGDPAGWWSVEEYPDTVVDAVEMAGFRDRYRGERVVIIGNGPSLNELDLSRLKPEYTIAVNGIFYAADQMGFDPSFYVVEDTAVMRDNLDEIRAYQAGHKFFPSIYRHMVGERPGVTYFMMNRGFYEQESPDFCIPRFSVDPSHHVFSGQSVTLINLQLAYHLGFEEVILVGMDFSYTVPPDSLVEGDIITSTSGDPNHFHPEYFGPGKVWKDPKLDRVLANYALAKEIYEADGRRIVNATAGGRLELFERADYTALFG